MDTEPSQIVPEPQTEPVSEQNVPAPEPPTASPAPASEPIPAQPPLSELRSRANAKRSARRVEYIQKILAFASTKPSFSNQHIRDLLHVSQSAATNYLSQLVREGGLKKQGKAKATRYSL